MKKVLYFLSSLMLVFTACDPMEDVYEELDKKFPDTYATDVTLDLAKADYELLKGHSAAKNLYFTNEQEAATEIPNILTKKYAHLDNGTTVTVGFTALSFPLFNNNAVSNVVNYTVTEEDYDVTGDGRYDSFNTLDDIFTILKHLYPNAEANKLAVLTYDWYYGAASPSTQEKTGSYYFVNGKWVEAYHVSVADYTSVNHTKYTFSSSDGDNTALYFDKFLKENVFGAKAGDVQYVSYAYYSSSSRKTSQRIMTMTFNGTSWVPVEKDMVYTSALQFLKEDGNWKPDITIKYALTSSDYQWIAGNAALGTNASRSNLGQYGNFYQGNPNSSNYWSQDMINVALAALLKNKYPNAEVGQKFLLTYVAYNGGNTSITIRLQLQPSGEYKVI
jgi:hypothetical protein